MTGEDAYLIPAQVCSGVVTVAFYAYTLAFGRYVLKEGKKKTPTEIVPQKQAEQAEQSFGVEMSALPPQVKHVCT